LNSIISLQNLIQQEINKYTLDLNLQPVELYEPISYTLKLGGKRMRPVLLMMAYEMFDSKLEKAIKPALGIEVFHNFTLLHDDIMDKAPLRRNQPTVHTRWNSDIAILSGDTMFVKSYQLMMQSENTYLRQVLEIFSETAIGVCEGQQLDMNFEKLDTISIDDYIKMIRLKTAVLLAGALQIGGIIGGASKQDAQHLYDFGINIGIAFQLQDDILDVFGDSEKFGKQVGGDILSNKKTYLLLKALELAKGNTAKELTNWLKEVDFNPAKKIEAVKNIYTELNVKKIAENKMNEFHTNAMQHFEALSVSSSKKEALLKFAESLLVREL
jgi:geranylgeranyl diphosphate synthase type II